ncbi:MAG: LON peptidase substrate-binding domain-containing protein [Myxococcales bacterium]|nr:LON peptidase substrate-binding domain-containing protein [Myxococcales bacterium]
MTEDVPQPAPPPGEPRPLALFPLENVVLFPRVRVPLHIFEPRYRQMVRDATGDEGVRAIGMAVVLPSHTAGMSGSPPLFDVGCEGVIEQLEALPSGRFNLVLAGTTRFRIVDEEPSDGERLYRVARVVSVPDSNPEEDAAGVAAARRDVLEAMRDLLARIAPARIEAFARQQFDRLGDEEFVNSFAQSIDFAPSEKQGLLEADRVLERYEKLVGLLRFRLAELASGHSPGSGVLQ